MKARRFGSVVALLLAGCARGVVIGEFEVEAARLERPQLTTVAVVAGTVQGDATLVVDAADGSVWEVPVHLGGGVVGGAFEIAVDPIAGSTTLDLGDADDPLPADDLLRTYHGRAGGFSAGIGLSTRTLRNGSGVRLDEAQFTVGAGVMLGFEWLKIRTRGPAEQVDGEDTADTGG